MVVAAAAFHRVFLREPQARNRLARVDHDGLRAGDHVGILGALVATPESSCRKFSPLRSAESTGRARCPRSRRAAGPWRRAVAIVGLRPGSFTAGSRQRKRGRTRPSAEHGILARDHGRAPIRSAGK